MFLMKYDNGFAIMHSSSMDLNKLEYTKFVYLIL